MLSSTEIEKICFDILLSPSVVSADPLGKHSVSLMVFQVSSYLQGVKY